MTAFRMKLADIPFEVICQYESTKEFCREYLTEDLPEFAVQLVRQEIDYEREMSQRQDKADGVPVREFSDEYLETLALHRRIAFPMLERGCLIFHGAGLSVENEGYLFTAKSGTGKTTHAKLWLKNIKNSYILNGDKPLIKVRDGATILYGTPWQGKEDYGVNDRVPLKALCILQRGSVNQIEPISFREAMPILYQQTYKTEDAEMVYRAMQLLGELALQVQC